MENKFTVRDFLVYFLTGFSLIIFYVPLKFDENMQILRNNQSLLKDFGTVIIVFFLLTFYLVGHIIQSVDLIRYLIVKRIIKNTIVDRKNKIFKLIVSYLANNRVVGILYFGEKNHDDFQKKVYYLQGQGKFNNSEYWYSLKDLFHGLEVVALSFSIWALFLDKFIFFGIYFFISISFWFEARFYSKEYVESVEYTYEENRSKE